MADEAKTIATQEGNETVSDTKTEASNDPNTNYSTFDNNAGNKNDANNDSNTTTTVTKQPTSTRNNATVALRFPEQNETEHWKYRLFGCMEDQKLCLSTCFCPCTTMARNAGYFYEDETEVGISYCLGGCWGLGGVMRWRIRQHMKIEGHMLEDVVVHMLCPCCALIQENREIYGEAGSHVGEELPLKKK